jgi:hypothetical protein
MLYQHQSSAAGTKGFDANKLTLFFAIRIQYNMDRITRDVLYLLHDIRVPILFIDLNRCFFFSTQTLEGGRNREK